MRYAAVVSKIMEKVGSMTEKVIKKNMMIRYLRIKFKLIYLIPSITTLLVQSLTKLHIKREKSSPTTKAVHHTRVHQSTLCQTPCKHFYKKVNFINRVCYYFYFRFFNNCLEYCKPISYPFPI